MQIFDELRLRSLELNIDIVKYNFDVICSDVNPNLPFLQKVSTHVVVLWIEGKYLINSSPCCNTVKI